jgi:gliding motility-associated-like protein
LQFNATGGTQFVWSPGTSLNKTNIADPIGLYTGNFDSITYKVVITDAAGCKDSTRVTVRVFRTEAQVFVPTAFTPNGDGHNDYFRPIPVGIARFEYFRVYNRWGELVYNNISGETGWDGRLNGRDQASGTYVWLLKGVDFGGRPIMQKGHVTLIR